MSLPHRATKETPGNVLEGQLMSSQSVWVLYILEVQGCSGRDSLTRLLPTPPMLCCP